MRVPLLIVAAELYILGQNNLMSQKSRETPIGRSCNDPDRSNVHGIIGALDMTARPMRPRFYKRVGPRVPPWSPTCPSSSEFAC